MLFIKILLKGMPEHEKNGAYQAQTGKKKIQSQLFLHVKNGEKGKNDHSDDFLHNFELSDGVEFVAHPVCRHLYAVFKKRYSPTHKNYQKNRFVLDLQMPVPRKTHENVRSCKKENGINSFHFSPQRN